MRPLPTLAITGGLLAAGLFAYDARRRGERVSAPPGSEGPARESRAPVLGPDDRARLEARLRALEARLDAEARALREASAAPPPGAPAPAPVEPASAAFLRPPPVGADGRPEVSDAVLVSLEAHVEEARRRMRDRHARRQVDASIERLGLALAPEQRTRLAEAVLAYRSGSETFWDDMKARGITHPHEQIAESRRRFRAFGEEIRSLVPADADLDRVVDGLIGRGSVVLPAGAEMGPPGVPPR
jgi:hypothetical protein